MIWIRKTYICHMDKKSRLCADIKLDGHETTMWFAVDRAQERAFSAGCSDAFVMALLPAAMRGGGVKSYVKALCLNDFTINCRII